MKEETKSVLESYAKFLSVELWWDGDWTGNSVYVGTDRGGPAIQCSGYNLFAEEADELFEAQERVFLEGFEILHELHHFLVAKLFGPVQLCFDDYGMAASLISTANQGYHLLSEKEQTLYERMQSPGQSGLLTETEANQQEWLCWWLDCFIGYLLNVSSHSMDCPHHQGQDSCLGWCKSWAHYYVMKEADFLKSQDGPYSRKVLNHYLQGARFILCWSLGAFLQEQIQWLNKTVEEWFFRFWHEVEAIEK